MLYSNNIYIYINYSVCLLKNLDEENDIENGPKDFNGYSDLPVHIFTSSCGEFNAKVFEHGITLATNFGQHLFLNFRDVTILKKRLEMCVNYLPEDNVYIYPWLYITYHRRVFSICRHYKKKKIVK